MQSSVNSVCEYGLGLAATVTKSSERESCFVCSLHLKTLGYFSHISIA
uniref:Uncharacterized protein n=1 Tax=Anguilla anguilla TaxID=7936 RepID=A0A0E9XB11_ANGAN